MAGSSKTTGARGKPPAAQEPANDGGELGLADLARGILAKEIRPRAVDVRRLAEAVLAGGGKPKKAKADGGGKKDKNKKKKLAKIPGQRTKK